MCNLADYIRIEFINAVPDNFMLLLEVVGHCMYSKCIQQGCGQRKCTHIAKPIYISIEEIMGDTVGKYCMNTVKLLRNIMFGLVISTTVCYHVSKSS